jgi:hypothetical protein
VDARPAQLRAGVGRGHLGDYAAVVGRAVKMPLGGQTCPVLSLDDLIAVRAFVGRPKDKLVEVELRAIRDRLAGRTS